MLVYGMHGNDFVLVESLDEAKTMHRLQVVGDDASVVLEVSTEGLEMIAEGLLEQAAMSRPSLPTATSFRDPRLQQMLDDPETYFANARIKAREQVEEAMRQEAAVRKRKAKEKRQQRIQSIINRLGRSK